MSELWDRGFREAAEAVFTRLDKTTFETLNRRVQHAFTVWRRRYQMTPQQDEYGWQLLTWAVNRAGRNASARIAAGDVARPYVYLRTAVATQMERVVNDPDAHEGFKRRADLVDVRDALREALA